MAEAECVEYKRELAVLKDELSECHRALDNSRTGSGGAGANKQQHHQPSWLAGSGSGEDAVTSSAEDVGGVGVSGSMRLTSLLREKNEVIDQLHSELEVPIFSSCLLSLTVNLATFSCTA
jgi:hypothetical protein